MSDLFLFRSGTTVTKMGNIVGGKKAPTVKMDSATALEEQWMDPHKRKVLAAIEDTIQTCGESGAHDHKTSDILRSIRYLCSVIYCANDFELIQKSQETFPALVKLLEEPSTNVTLRLEIVSAVSVLCQGNQVNCRAWCVDGGIKALLSQLRELPVATQAEGALHRPNLQMNVWVIYTLRTLMCGSPEAIKAVVASGEFAKTADLLVKMYKLKEVWQRTAEQQNYALDCCVLLGIGGPRKLYYAA